MTSDQTATTEGRPDMFATDFDALERGDSYESATRQIDGRDVAIFAALTGDDHPIHVNPAFAAQGPFGRQIAHGLLVLSCAVGSLPLDPDRVLALRRIREAVFKRPVAVGESIAVTCRVSELRPVDERSGLVDCEWRILGADGKLRARVLAEILWRRGPHDPTAVSAAALANFNPPLADPSEAAAELAPVEVTNDGLRVLV
ncbi:MAG: hypothetical protein JJE23_00210 [Thermoleophilia bacterium]|nr:hypothetical protein [Thermoleophilia bacterium]